MNDGRGKFNEDKPRQSPKHLGFLANPILLNKPVVLVEMPAPGPRPGTMATSILGGVGRDLTPPRKSKRITSLSSLFLSSILGFRLLKY